MERTATAARLHLAWPPLVAAWIAQTLGWLLMLWVWRRILARMGAAAPWRDHLVAQSYAGLTHVLPGSVWAPASRVALYRARGVAAWPVGAALVVEWLLVGIGGLALYGASAPWSSARSTAGAWPIALAAAGSVLVLHPSVAGRLLRWAHRRTGRAGPPPVAPDAGTLAGWLGAELVVLAMSGVALYWLMTAIAPAASLPDAMAAWGLSMAVANLLVWLPATSLLKDVGMVLLLTPLYDSAALALAVTIAWRLWMVGVMVSWAAGATLVDRRSRAPGFEA